MKVYVVCSLILVALLFGLWFSFGIGGMGPTNNVTATVISKHVDTEGVSGDVSSSYMVVTDNGTFEVDNGLLLELWNADELYGVIQIGKTYTFTTKGNRYTNMFIQVYPYIVNFE